MPRILLKILFCVIILIFASNVYAADSFAWIDVDDNQKALNEVRTAFASELKPDDPEEVKPIIPYSFKYIARTGAFRNTRLVIVGYREHEGDAKEFDHFRAFSYDLSSRLKREVEPKGIYYQWSFLRLAVFEPRDTPDVVFKFFHCLECEAVELLASFKFDSTANVWNRRIWPDNDRGLMIGSEIQSGHDELLSYDCLYKIADFTSDKFADIAIRCRETGEDTREVKDNLLLYTIQKGAAKKIQIRDKDSFKRISQVLCQSKDSPLCKTK